MPLSVEPVHLRTVRIGAGWCRRRQAEHAQSGGGKVFAASGVTCGHGQFFLPGICILLVVGFHDQSAAWMPDADTHPTAVMIAIAQCLYMASPPVMRAQGHCVVANYSTAFRHVGQVFALAVAATAVPQSSSSAVGRTIRREGLPIADRTGNVERCARGGSSARGASRSSTDWRRRHDQRPRMG